MGPGLVFFPLLFVDDDPLMARAVHRLLQGGTCDLRTAASVPDAMTLIDSEPAWCGVITDYHLPGGNGLEVVGELRARQPDVPALVVTGDGDPAVTNACVRADVHCVRKPFIVDDLERFLSAVDDYDRGPQGPRFHRLQREVGTTPPAPRMEGRVYCDANTNGVYDAGVDGSLGIAINLSVQRVDCNTDAPIGAPMVNTRTRSRRTSGS